MTADNVELLGRDVAVYGYGKLLVYVAAGIVQMNAGVIPFAQRTGTGSGAKAAK
jgi:hypothetical protein